MNIKYQYSHFIYPFVIDEKNYYRFIKSIVQNRKYELKIHNMKQNEELYNFYLPYMRKFIFPTLYWNTSMKNKFKKMDNMEKSYALSKLTSVSFDYRMNNVKECTLLGNKNINFDIVNIRLICFKPGICFFDIKTELDNGSSQIPYNDMLDFNHMFREITNDAYKIGKEDFTGINEVLKLIRDTKLKYESKNLENMYHDRMFTYSYACTDDKFWDIDNNLKNIKNDFYKYQYVVKSNSDEIFNEECDKVKENIYSRWKYSLFGFSKESCVALAAQRGGYNITKMPYNFEKMYLYMLLFAFYQRISLINFSNNLLSCNKDKIKKLKSQFTKFTHCSWFGQITNSEHGMGMWKMWQKTFELPELYSEVNKEYSDYFNSMVTSGQDKINMLLILLYTASVIFAGLSIIIQLYDIKGTWIENITIYTLVITSLSYPIFLIGRWIKRKLESTLGE